MRIVLTIGDCNGIGIEVMINGLSHLIESGELSAVTLSICTNEQVLADYIKLLTLPAEIRGHALWMKGQRFPLIACKTQAELMLGNITVEAGALAIESLNNAVDALLDKKADAVVTLPVSKYAMQIAGGAYPGQTEFLADRCGVRHPMMILCTDSTRVGLVTIHESLRNVPTLITKQRVEERIQTFRRSLQYDFGCKNPHIAVLGLNPHAGEEGKIGQEEIESIAPAIQECTAQGIIAEGPFPADGFFAHGAYRHYDGILAMYHDQGLIPLKLLAGGGGVNFSAGLPIVRTSPDHGTAFQIAGQGRANPASTIEAIRTALSIVHARNTYQHPLS